MTFHSMESRGITTRRLRYAIAASLLLHLLLFWPEAPHLLNRDAPALLQATLGFSRQAPLQPAVSPPPPRLAAAKPARAAATTPAKPGSPESIPEPNALEPSKTVSVPPARAEQALAPAKATPAAESVVAASLPGAAATAVPTAVSTAVAGPVALSAGSPGEALLTDANAAGEALHGLRGYRLAVASQARRFKRYPAQAMANGWAGSAEIRVEVGRDGQPRNATVARSSGHEALDRAALAMIDAGATRARAPESLRGRAFAIVLPVMFNLDDE